MVRKAIFARHPAQFAQGVNPAYFPQENVGDGPSLGVIGLAEVGVEHLLSARLLVAGYGLRRDKY